LTGLRFFTGLEELDCYNNCLVELDVSNNANLKVLFCLNNQLTTLDVSNNAKLEYLSCPNNQLTTLDVSNNAKLESLFCSNNQLTTLDVSHNLKLRWLSCEFNKLSTLDVSNNTMIEYLICYRNIIPSHRRVTGWENNEKLIINSFDDLNSGTFSFYPQNTPQVFGIVLCQSSRRAEVTLYDSDGYAISRVLTDQYGFYQFNVPESESCRLVVTIPGYLSFTINNLVVNVSYFLNTIDMGQLAGDVNGDGVVNATDLTYLLSEFNRAPVNYQYADIDGNGVVNAADLTYLLAGFNNRDVVVEFSDFKLGD
jgi:hypothetical protein